MKVNALTKSICRSSTLKKGLELAADNGTLFAAGTSLCLSTFVRPVFILATPKTDKENKKLACAKSIASSAIGFGVLLCVSKPIARAIKGIDKAPKKYLKSETIENLKEGIKPITSSKSYRTITQMFKLGVGLAVAAPKSVLTSTITPKVNDMLLNRRSDEKNNTISFKGGARLNPISKVAGKIIDKPITQKIANTIKDTNYPMHISSLTDSVATLTFVKQTQKDKSIKEERKNVLCKNALISTGLCITGGYVLDKALEKPTQKFIDTFSKVNKNNPKLPKYIEGIKIAKPTLILGGIYYAVIPVISTFFAERIGRKNKQA